MFRTIMSAAAILLFGASLALAAPVTLKLGHIAEPENPYGQGADHFAKLVKERTNGEVEIKVYPSSQLGNQRDLVEGLTFGTVDMTLTGTAVLGNFVPEVAVFDLPSFSATCSMPTRPWTPWAWICAKGGEGQGMITWPSGKRRAPHDQQRSPHQDPESMKGLKFRVMEQPVYIEMMKALGASPTPMAMSELYTALQKGVIDGQENPLAHIATKHFYEVQKYLSLTGHTYAAEPVLISTIAWEKAQPRTAADRAQGRRGHPRLAAPALPRPGRQIPEDHRGQRQVPGQRGCGQGSLCQGHARRVGHLHQALRRRHQGRSGREVSRHFSFLRRAPRAK